MEGVFTFVMIGSFIWGMVILCQIKNDHTYSFDNSIGFYLLYGIGSLIWVWNYESLIGQPDELGEIFSVNLCWGFIVGFVVSSGTAVLALCSENILGPITWYEIFTIKGAIIKATPKSQPSVPQYHRINNSKVNNGSQIGVPASQGTQYNRIGNNLNPTVNHRNKINRKGV